MKMLMKKELNDVTLTTRQKGKMVGKINMEERIAYLENEIKKEAIKEDQR